MNYLKFRHPFLFPLQDQVWTELNEHRREVLAANGGSLVGLQFFPSSLVNYFRPDGIRFTGVLPVGDLPGRAGPGVRRGPRPELPTGSVTAFMPLLAPADAGQHPDAVPSAATPDQRAVRLIWVGALLVTGGVMAYGYVAYRYTSEFIPVLLVGGVPSPRTSSAAGSNGPAPLPAVGSWRWLRCSPALGAAREHHGRSTPRRDDVQGRAAGALPRAAGQPQRRPDSVREAGARTSGGLPTGGRSADDLWIRGDCDALTSTRARPASPGRSSRSATRPSVRTDPIPVRAPTR